MKVAKRTSHSLLALVGYGPNYVSQDTVVGLAECLQFFPSDYKNASETGVEEPEPDDDGEVKTKKKKKKRKAAKEGGKDENKEDGTGPDDRADNEGGEEDGTDGEDDEEGSEYETDDEESDDAVETTEPE